MEKAKFEPIENIEELIIEEPIIEEEPLS